eukprot:CAMPEP_0119569172 /NCGR_PEP_ID=MMETSP1352-20130426/40921_1 /TAXON_ID=265584 /ORGANISM="Stauroneis constricta, Strain CCMP1120" /LENGTH=61 /DNA_ID=CAMNT_0007618685 /DNA_START=142 /DNA_END=327 /DNA_ORIENTATION=+
MTERQSGMGRQADTGRYHQHPTTDCGLMDGTLQLHHHALQGFELLQNIHRAFTHGMRAANG